jgi:hypothetical protein
MLIIAASMTVRLGVQGMLLTGGAVEPERSILASVAVAMVFVLLRKALPGDKSVEWR